MLILPSMYQSTIFGTSVRPRAPPKAVPFHDPSGDELERTGGDLLAGFGDADHDALAPAAMAAFQRLAHHVGVAGGSNEKSAPPPVRSTIACTTLSFPTSRGLMKSVMPNLLAIVDLGRD